MAIFLAKSIAPQHVNVFMCLVEALLECDSSYEQARLPGCVMAQALALLKALSPYDATYREALLLSLAS